MEVFHRIILPVILLGSLCLTDGQEPSEGTMFAVALPPTYYSGVHGELTISAKDAARVTIATMTSQEEIYIAGDWSVSYNLDESMRTTNWIEGKGIVVYSDAPITVHVSSTGYYYYHTPDATIARPVLEDDLEYFIASHDRTNTNDCSRPMSFYVVAATQNDTNVVIYRKLAGNYVIDANVILNQYEVFTRDASYQSGGGDIDYTGAHVVATKPVAVYSGNGCAVRFDGGQGDHGRYMFESMPRLSELGLEYQSFPLAFGDTSYGYVIRIVAVENDTDVNVPEAGVAITLSMGDFTEVDDIPTNGAYLVTCSKGCLVAQYAKTLPPGDTPRATSSFMTVLTPSEQMTNNLVFATPEVANEGSYTTSALSLLVTKYPVRGLQLNDTKLDDLDWTPVAHAQFWHATLVIEPGYYQLLSYEANEKFAAYMHIAYGSGNVHSVGMPVGYGVIGPIYSDDRTNPFIETILRGNFSSATGEDYTPECSAAYNQNLQEKAHGKIPDLNSMIGSDLCQYLGELDDIKVMSVSTAFFTNGQYGITDIRYLIQADNNMRIDNVHQCARELNEYLRDFDNWGYPVIPPVPGCPVPVFNPNYFWDGSTGNDWVCTSLQAEEQSVSEFPGYSLGLYDEFYTLFNDELDFPCSQTYLEDWRTKALSMGNVLNDRINSGDLCQGLTGKFSVLTATTIFTPQLTTGSISATYFMTVDEGSLTFIEVYQCVDAIFDFLELHSNWGTVPLLPAPPGCPVLVFNPPEFTHNGEQWEC